MGFNSEEIRMALTYVIGNGFDINLGLKTKYSDFYDHYLKQDSPNGNLLRFKSNILKDIDNTNKTERT